MVCRLTTHSEAKACRVASRSFIMMSTECELMLLDWLKISTSWPTGEYSVSAGRRLNLLLRFSCSYYNINLQNKHNSNKMLPLPLSLLNSGS